MCNRHDDAPDAARAAREARIRRSALRSVSTRLAAPRARFHACPALSAPDSSCRHLAPRSFRHLLRLRCAPVVLLPLLVMTREWDQVGGTLFAPDLVPRPTPPPVPAGRRG